MERSEISLKIKQEVELLSSQELDDLDLQIFKSGFLDSINVLNLIIFIENTFNFKVQVFDVSLDIFASVNCITDYVNEKING